MARPIEFGWRLEGEATREFWENEKKPAVPQQIQLLKGAEKMAERIRFEA
jgi:hypothetical protein